MAPVQKISAFLIFECSTARSRKLRSSTSRPSLGDQVPEALGRYLGDPDREKANRVMQAMFKMKTIVVADLDRAAAA